MKCGSRSVIDCHKSNVYVQAHCIYPFLLHLGLGLVAGAAQVVVVVAPADHLVPLLGAGLVGAAWAHQRRDDLVGEVYFLCLFFVTFFHTLVSRMFLKPSEFQQVRARLEPARLHRRQRLIKVFMVYFISARYQLRIIH